ncbi:tetratricopeptide repeat protein [Hymenobacter busanensis]|uniref:Tetratricopeptide repeat protein n=1 Tax=Hymenobacter busanensis TaxID=2607656 RepID=A0A7L4ZY20_9BACT|nr:tetratricopeptide repeat protein [Hymenobacter busanensis]KAA9333163.1 tetratricopeptide repeat protein [Hymenobacter busanensis]QHJ08161.1 tetratricopeptide repeat protein [Hymenobacter busanensis]
MKYLIYLAAVLGSLLALPAHAQKTKVKTKGAATTVNRQLALFGGVTPEAAQAFMGEAFLKGIDQNFASRAEASRFFANKGYEYFTEGQPDTARYRFNLAWMLDPQNADAYRGLGLLTSSTALDESIGLLEKGLAVSAGATQAVLHSDLGASYLLRYEKTKKSKDLKTALEHLNQAVTLDANNSYAYQQLGRAYYLQGEYAKAWEAVHKGRSHSLQGVDFGFISELVAKMPDPQGVFK